MKGKSREERITHKIEEKGNRNIPQMINLRFGVWALPSDPKV